MKKLKNLKKILLYLNLSIGALIPVSAICSDKNWLQSKLDTLINKMITRHTYDHNSFEHMRDRALLCMVPSNIAQAVLTSQRSNMKKFLKRNRQEALAEIRQYSDNQERWDILMEETQKIIIFNRNAMQQVHIKSTDHDLSLPSEWLNAINFAAKIYKFKPQNIRLTTTEIDAYAIAKSEKPSNFPLNPQYNPTEIGLNIKAYLYSKDECIQMKYPQLLEFQLKLIAVHELTHLAEGDSEEWLVIAKNVSLIGPAGAAEKKYQAAVEKNADTLVLCDSPELAHYASEVIKYDLKGYRENNNDMLVLNTNWKTSQAITNYQQLKSSIKQKLTLFPKFVG